MWRYLAAAFAALLGLCGSARADIVVGMLLSTTGPSASLGIPERNTMELLPHAIAGQNLHRLRTGQDLGIEPKQFGQPRIEFHESWSWNRGWIEPGIEARRKRGIGIVKRDTRARHNVIWRKPLCNRGAHKTTLSKFHDSMYGGPPTAAMPSAATRPGRRRRSASAPRAR